MKPRFSLPLSMICCLVGSSHQPLPASAQISEDGTTSTVVEQNGDDFTINQGDRAGDNLFHSFRDFSVPNGGSAFFDNAPDIANIFSRVTGGNISNIDGLIRANGAANLFLINPAGIMFGRDARLDIGGSFFGSSAESILFEDGEFSATDLENPPLLTVNAPIGLGFRDNPKDIVNTSVGVNPDGETNVTGGAVGLQVPDGATLAIVGGNVLLDDGNLTAKGGHIELGSVLGEGQVGITETDIGFVLDYDSVDSFGNITLQNTAVVDVTANGGGSINVNSQNLLLENSSLNAGIFPGLGSPGAQAGNITFNATNSVNIINGNVFNRVFSEAIGNAGNIDIEAGNLRVTSGSVSASTFGRGNAGNLNISTSNSVEISGERPETRGGTGSPGGLFAQVDLDGEGNAGNLNIETERLSISDGSKVQVATFGRGNAGNLTIRASEIEIFNTPTFSNFTTGIFASVAIDPLTESPPQGEAGNVTIETNFLSLRDGGKVEVSTEGVGNAGNLLIKAEELVEVSGVDPEPEDGSSFIGAEVEEGATGLGGNVAIETKQLNIRDRGGVTVSTSGTGNAGSLNINASESVLVNGGGSFILNSASSEAIGDAGDTFITTKNLTISDGAEISNSTFGEGNAGKIVINASESVNISSFVEFADIAETDVDAETAFSSIESDVNSGATGNGGSLTIETKKLDISGYASVGTSTSGVGNAGNTIIRAYEFVNIQDTSTDAPLLTGIAAQSNPGATGNAGNITIETKNLNLNGDDTRLGASTFGDGSAGNLEIIVGKLFIENGAEVQTIAFANGDAGNLTIEASELVQVNGIVKTINTRANELDGGELVTFPDARFGGIFASAIGGGEGDAGNLTINTNNLIVQDFGTITTSNFQTLGLLSPGRGAAGNLTINANSVEVTNGTITAANASGIGGNLTINADSLSLDDRTSIEAFTTSETGQGGIINLNVDGNLLMRDNSEISARADNGATGGIINLNADSIVAFPNQNSDILASAEEGQGGEINITTEALFGIEERPQNPLTNDINASSGVGLDGTVSITTPDVNVLQNVIELPSGVVEAEQTVAQVCEANRENIAQNGLIIKGKGGVPPQPTEPLTSDVIIAQQQTAKPQASYPDIKPIKTSIGDIFPARGIITTKSGEVILTAYPTDSIDTRTPYISANCS